MGIGKNLGYVRVSTIDQNEARQKEALEKYGIDRWYVEKASGKDMNRPKLQEMLDYVRDGDTVYVEEFSRLGRSTRDLFDIVERIRAAGGKFVSVKEQFDPDTPTGEFQMTMMAALATFERKMILERQREGIEIAKRAGKYKGRKKIAIHDIGRVYDQYMAREKSKAQIARELGISRNTLDRLFKEHAEGGAS